MMKILYAILSCLPNRHKSIWQKKSWLQHLECDDYFVHLYGEADKYGPYHINNDLFLPCSDGPEGIPFKYAYTIAHLNLNDFDYVFFCDDDTWVNTNLLKEKVELIEDSEKEDFCYGRIGVSFHNGISNKYCDYPVRYPDGGAGFLVPSSIIDEISYFIQTNENIPISKSSDVSFGHWLKKIGKNNDIFISDYSLFNHEACGQNPKEVITYHYCDESDFKLLEEKFGGK